MRAFICKRCRELAPFESQKCRACRISLGFDPLSGNLEALDAHGAYLVPFSPGSSGPGTGHQSRWALCQRSALTGCNWLLPAEDAGRPCISCRLTGNLPPLKDQAYCAAFAKAEVAKRRLIYQLRQLRLPIISRREAPEAGLDFQLVAGDRHVVTGHQNGVVTLDLNETDDSFREQTRAQFGEPYRTLLGHFRHEIGHYYWLSLLATPAQPRTPGAILDEARQVFGYDQADYAAARKAHYV